MLFNKPATLPSKSEALPGYPDEMLISNQHYINGNPLKGPFPENMETAIFGMGCFWGVERKFWEIDGVYTTAAGYAGGHTENATYRDVCSGKTGHTEVVLVVFDPTKVSYDDLLKVFWESHDPTQGMRQGNDTGTQYRSAIFTTTEAQATAAESTKQQYQGELNKAGQNQITTEIAPASDFYYAEEDHQQYLAKNPAGYCGLKGTGVSCV